MAIFKAVNSYSLSIPVNTSNVRGVVRLLCADGWTVTIQCQETTALPINQLNIATKSLLAFAPAGAYTRMADLVRNEKPARVVINEAVTPVTLYIETGNEPLGEGEA